MQKTLTQRLFICATIAVLSLTTGFVEAKEYNKPNRIKSKSQAGVNKAFAKAFKDSDPNVRRGSTVINSGNCSSNVGVGNVVLSPGQRAPREITIAIREVTVVNVNRGCR